MMTIKFLSLKWETLLLRYFLMMFAVIAGVLTQIWAITFLGLPLFLSAILGVAIVKETDKAKRAKLIKIPSGQRSDKKVS